ncbi:MAG: hypothetical protein HRT53_16190 [Colwellia sp.]|nr:hypothetical protein [Colwellia sp.]
MSYLKKVYQKFIGKLIHKSPQVDTSINFSDLVLNIQKNINAVNTSKTSLEIDYIDKYFDKKPSRNQGTALYKQLDQLENYIDLGDKSLAINLLNTMKQTMQKSIKAANNQATNYQPKMTVFEMPVYTNGKWLKELIEIPLFVFEPLYLHSIKEFTFSSKLDYVKSEGNEVYVRFHQKTNKFWSNWKPKESSSTQVKILFSPEQNLKELNKVISEYKELLRPNS